MSNKKTTSEEPEAKIKEALRLALEFSGYDGDHHKAWAIDQMVRVLAGDYYSEFVALYEIGEDGPNTYKWDEGIAP